MGAPGELNLIFPLCRQGQTLGQGTVIAADRTSAQQIDEQGGIVPFLFLSPAYVHARIRIDRVLIFLLSDSRKKEDTGTWRRQQHLPPCMDVKATARPPAVRSKRAIFFIFFLHISAILGSFYLTNI